MAWLHWPKVPPLVFAVFLTLGVIFHAKCVIETEDFATTYSTTQKTANTRPLNLSTPWLQFFDSFSFEIPVLVIDHDLLRSILSGANPSEDQERKLTVAVDDRFRNMKISENDERLHVIYYTKHRSDREYWQVKFGNETRAMLPIELVSYSLFFLPSNIRSFLEEWNSSRFIDCHVLLKRNSTENRAIPVSFVQHMAELRDFIKQRGAKVILGGGTLLGWYRECSLISHTTDIDFYIRAEEYTPYIRDDLDARLSPYKLSRIFGKPSDSFELTVQVKAATDVNVDLFFLYTNSNESYVGGLDWFTRKKYKWSYSRISSLCTADLFGRLFHVPCNAKEILDMEYGNWQDDAPTSDFVWYKSHLNVKENGVYTREEMKEMRPPGWRWLYDLLSFIVLTFS